MGIMTKETRRKCWVQDAIRNMPYPIDIYNEKKRDGQCQSQQSRVLRPSAVLFKCQIDDFFINVAATTRADIGVSKMRAKSRLMLCCAVLSHFPYLIGPTLRSIIQSCLPKTHHPAPHARSRFSPSGRGTAAILPLASFDGDAFLLGIWEAKPIPTHTSRIAVFIAVVKLRAPKFGRENAIGEELCNEATYAARGGVYSCVFEASGLGEEEVVDCCWGELGVT
jgi:hypothetical protein